MKVDFVIIGAGISGIAFARELQATSMIIEAQNEIGGYCKSLNKGNYCWDYSGHFLHFRNETIKEDILSRIQNVVHFKRQSSIIYNDKIIDYPFQENTRQLGIKNHIICYISYVMRSRRKTRTFKQQAIATNGNEICKKFIFPYNEKLYACNLDQLDKYAMGRFFPIGNPFKKKKIHYNDNLYYPAGGIQQMIKSMVRPNSNIHLNERVIKINLKQKTLQTNKRTIKYKYLINTSPYNKFIKILGNQLPQRELSYNKVLVYNLGFDKPTDHKKHWYYIPDKEICFYRVGFYNNITKKKKMSLYVEIGLSKDQTIQPKIILKKILIDLKKIGIITNHKLIASHHVELNPAYVHINEADKKYVSTTQTILKEKGVYNIGRYAKWQYSSMEDCIIEAYQLARTFNQQIYK